MKKKIWIIILLLLVIGVLYFTPTKTPTEPVKPQEPQFQYDFKSLSECAKLDDNALKSSCYNVIAVKKLDATMCLQYNEGLSLDFCYYNIGVRMQSKKLCQKILDEQLKADCEWQIT